MLCRHTITARKINKSHFCKSKPPPDLSHSSQMVFPERFTATTFRAEAVQRKSGAGSLMATAALSQARAHTCPAATGAASGPEGQGNAGLGLEGRSAPRLLLQGTGTDAFSGGHPRTSPRSPPHSSPHGGQGGFAAPPPPRTAPTAPPGAGEGGREGGRPPPPPPSSRPPVPRRWDLPGRGACAAPAPRLTARRGEGPSPHPRPAPAAAPLRPAQSLALEAAILAPAPRPPSRRSRRQPGACHGTRSADGARSSSSCSLLPGRQQGEAAVTSARLLGLALRARSVSKSPVDGAVFVLSQNHRLS